MTRYRWFLVAAASFMLVGPALANGIFKKQPKPDPSARVPELINLLRTEQDKKKRESAVEELRNYDSRNFPEIITILVEIALNEPTTGVRLEAVESLGKIRPVSQQAGRALEQVVDKDDSIRVRLRARSLLIQYHLAGYRSGKNPEAPPVPKGAKTDEPPLADPPEYSPVPVNAPMLPGKLKPAAQWPAPMPPNMPEYKPLPIPPANPSR